MSTPHGDPASILLVDDRPENMVALEAVLEPLGQRLVRATSGEEALRRVLAEDFAVILLDVEMPGLDGFQTAEYIKSRQRTRHIPIIFITAESHRPQLFRGYEAGAVDFLQKPFDSTVLTSKVSVFVDLHRLKREAEQLAHRAVHDALTGLPNRVLLMDRLQVALAGVERRTTQVAVFFFDLDGFKLVNDTLGHEAGDELLGHVAERLTELVRPADTVARFAGDEFAVIAEVPGEEDATDIARRILEAIAAPFVLEAGETFVTASIGIALASGGDEDSESLLREADAAMYRAKQLGGGRHEIYDSRMRARASERIETENALRGALERAEFCVHYQPKVALATGAIVGIEALLRWQHPELGLTGAGEFLTLAEQTSLVVPIGALVLEEALHEAQRWRRAHPGHESLQVSVNVSGRQLAWPEFVPSVRRALEETRTEPELLCLEVSETVVVESAKATTAALKELSAMGVRLALDDFGSGLSSLPRMTQLSIEALKVDRPLVADLTRLPESRSIVAAIVGLAGALGFTSIAEGVETAEQLLVLRELGCEVAQGNYFSPPLDAESVMRVLDEGAVLPGGDAAALRAVTSGDGRFATRAA